MRWLYINLDLAFADNWVVELADLIALRKIRVEIILAVKTRPVVDFRLQAEARAYRLFNALLVDDRQHAWHRRINERNIAVRVRAKLGRSTRKELRFGRNLRMDFEAHHKFPVSGVAFQRIGRPLAHFAWSFKQFLLVT